MQKILFTGGSGLLAINCAIYLRNEFEVYLGLHNRIIHLKGVKTCILNLENEKELERELLHIKPDILINAAANTNVEECELNPEEAKKINTIIPGVLAKISKKLNIFFVHISTDHLFDGSKSFQTEKDLISPLNIYGKSKANGEQEVMINNNEALIIRTNFFAWGTSYRQSFSDFIINSLRQGKKITLFDDVFFTPILIHTLIDHLKSLFKAKINGILNVVSDERISKYEFGILIADIFELDKNLIEKGSIENNKSLIKRPKDMSLSNLKIKNILISSQLPSLVEQISILLKKEPKTKI